MSVRATVGEVRMWSRFLTQVGKSWVPTAAAWGGGAGAVLLYLTDWKVVLDKVPFVKGKFEHEAPR